MKVCRYCGQTAEDAVLSCTGCGGGEFNAPLRLDADRTSAAADPAVLGPAGVAGWLRLFVVVQLYVAPVLFAVGTLLSWLGLSLIGGAGAKVVFIGVVGTVVGGFLIYRGMTVAIALRDLQPLAVQRAREWLILVLVWKVAEFVLSFLSAIPLEEALPRSFLQLAAAGVGFAVWYTYFARSRRVKATYADADLGTGLVTPAEGPASA